MAKAGNHGIIIPRDRELLRRLYWDGNMTTVDLGRMFGVTHKSIINAMRQLGVPTRSKGVSPVRPCIECGAPPVRIKHKKNGATYGRRCLTCQRAHKAAFGRIYGADEQKRRRKKFLHDRWYDFGPLNPEGEKSWMNKCKALLRSVKRAAATGKPNRVLSLSANVALRRGQTLPV